ncbi:hypothetical protein LR48_Vigan04g115400 [Vigna angularis]|uniref:Uncharacterized protein n=1 Tax=Phaseolus angularis TaxID=3914 RepID=A0A0L9UE43_PHAAN|nr:hypothetical protein LR48_Vigan04g115400 [Vigna angularis]
MKFHQQVHDAFQHFKLPWYLLGDKTELIRKVNPQFEERPWMPLSAASPLPMEKTVNTQRQTLSAPPSPPNCPAQPPRLPQHSRHLCANRFCLHDVQPNLRTPLLNHQHHRQLSVGEWMNLRTDDTLLCYGGFHVLLQSLLHKASAGIAAISRHLRPGHPLAPPTGLIRGARES